jgi:hypothetical protein
MDLLLSIERYAGKQYPDDRVNKPQEKNRANQKKIGGFAPLPGQ